LEDWASETKDARFETRKLRDMIDVLYDRQFAKSADLSMDVYHVYRNIPFSSQTNTLYFPELRYDITTIPSSTLGQEYRKTYGHYHALSTRGIPHAEVYEVLQGTAHVLLQKKDGEKIVDVRLVEGSLGDKVVVPPSYGHLLINAGTETLATGNLISRRCQQSNEFFRRMRGGAYYELAGHQLVRNPVYGKLPEGVIEGPSTRFPSDCELRNLLLRDPESFRFLIDPFFYPDTF
jgi:glucose-6-phosphate isomerase